MPTGLLTPPFGRAVALNRASPLAQRMAALILPGYGLPDLVTGQRSTSTGTVVRIDSRLHRVRGFGTTFGVGASDVVLTSSLTRTTQRSYAMWTYRNGDGGLNFGAPWIGSDNLFINGSGQPYIFEAPFNTTNGRWSFARPTLQAWAHIVITYDGSATANNAVVYVNGESVSVTRAVAPVGTINNAAAVYRLGNNAAGTIVWDGMLGPFMVWDRILSAAEARRLYAPDTRWELFRPLSGLPWRIVVQAPASTITGTGAVTINEPAIAGEGTAAAPSFTGSGAVQIGPPVIAAEGAYTPEAITGTAAVQIGAPSISASGAYTPAEITGTGAVTIERPSISGFDSVAAVPALVTLSDATRVAVALSDAAVCVVTLGDSAA